MKANKFLAIIAVIFSFNFASAQGDFCSTATSLGSLPTPGACLSGLQDGAVVNTNGTTVGSTADNPYVYQTGCQGGGQMDAPANDVWYSFVATGSVLNISISGLPQANVGLWSGTCGSLAGAGCLTTGGAGTGSATITQLVIGNTYYVSVTSSNANGTSDGPFTLSLDNDIDCNDCLRQASLTATPAPTNGGYEAGDVVTFCYTVTDFVQTSTNWFHGVQITMGAGWTGTITNPVPATGCGYNPPGPGDPSIGQWGFFNSVTSSATGSTFGQGFYWDAGSTPDGNPGNNFGDPNDGSCTWTFCWDLTVGPCTSGMDLGVTVNTSGDGESGSWTSVACGDDDPTNFAAVGVCCPSPVMDSTDVCGTACNGTVTADGNGALSNGNGPWDYVWTDGGGSTIATHNNLNGPSTVTGLCAGTYNVTITDATNCVSTGSVTINSVTENSAGTDDLVNPLCNNTTLDLNTLLSGNTTTGTWSETTGSGQFNTGTGVFNANGLTANTYNFIYVVTNTTPCVNDTAFFSVQVSEQNSAGADDLVNPLCNNTTLDLNTLLSGNTATGTWSETTGSGQFNAGTGVFNANGLTANTYNFIYVVTNTAPCVNDTAFFSVQVNVQNSAGADDLVNPLCNNTTLDLNTLLSGNTTTGSWFETTSSGQFNAGTGVFNANGLGAATYTFIYVVTNTAPCVNDTANFSVQVNVQNSAGADDLVNPLCNNTTLDLNTLLSGNTAIGTWAETSGSGQFNTGTGVFNANGLAAATYTFTYTVTNAAPCVDDVANFSVQVNVQNSAGADDLVNPLCNNTTLDLNTLLSGNTTTGTWSETTSSGQFNTGTGVFNANGLTANTYNFIYVVTNTAPCVNDTAFFSVQVNVQNSAGADDLTNPLCNNTTLDLNTLLSGNTATGTWAETSGSGQFNAGTGVFNANGLAAATYTFTYTVTNAAPCVDDVANFSVQVNEMPVVSPVSASLCENVVGSGQALNVDVTGLEPSLNATGTFVWYTDNTYGTPSAPQPTNVTVNNGQTFYFEVTLNGCSVQDSVTYTVTGNIALNDPSPDFCEDIAGTGQVTGIDLTTFNSGVFAGAATFTWATGPTGVTINDGDVINVQVQTPGCPTVNINVNFTVDPLPTANQASLSLCETTLGGGQATFDLTTLNSTVNGGNGNGVNWFANFADIPGSPIATPAAYTAGTSTVFAQVTGPAPTNCTDTAAISLTVIPAASAGADNVDTLCNFNGNSSDLNLLLVGNTTTGTWTETTATPSGQFNTGTGVLDATNLTPGDYTFIYVVAGNTPCPDDTADFTVTINSLPTAIDLTPQLCEVGAGSGSTPGVDLTLNNTNVDGGAGHTITWFAGVPPSSPVGTPTSVTVNNGDVFYALVDNGNCTDTAMITYSVTATISLNNPNDSLCEDSPGSGSVAGVDLTSYNTNIYAGVSPTYSWYTDAAMTNLVTGLTNFTITASTADTFYVDVTDGTCNNNIMVTFTVNPLPISNPAAITVCDDGTGQATFDLTTLDNTVNGGNGNTVTWFANFADIPGNPIATPGAYVSGSATIFAQVTGPNSTACTDTAAITLTVNPLPTANTASLALCDDGTGQATFDLTSLDNTVNGGNGNPVTWFASAANIPGSPIAGANAYVSGSAVVFAQVTDPTTNCTDTVSITLSVDPQLTISAISDTSLCVGDNIVLTATGSGNGTINWYSDMAGTNIIGTGNTFTIPSSSVGVNTYYVNETGTCPSNMESFTVTVEEALASINASPISGNVPLEVFFGNGSTTGVNYSWDFGDGNGSTSFEPTNIYNEMGIYTATLTVTSNIGCSATATVEIEAIAGSALFIPNVFSPNNDGENDVFTVDGENLQSVKGEIFNRWGQKMFAWEHVKGYWDGRTLSGSEAPEGTYFYIISAVGFDGQEYFKKGTVSLFR